MNEENNLKTNKKRMTKKDKIIITILLGAIVIIVGILVYIIYHRNHQPSKNNNNNIDENVKENTNADESQRTEVENKITVDSLGYKLSFQNLIIYQYKESFLQFSTKENKLKN